MRDCPVGTNLCSISNDESVTVKSCETGYYYNNT